MRMIILFDLPTITRHDRKEYTKFRKFLVNEGFIMMQESVYCKLLLNSTSAKSQYLRVDKNKPRKGLVQLLVITEKQYLSMIYVVGEGDSKIRDDDNRIVII